MNREALVREYPNLFLLDPTDVAGLRRYLAGRTLIAGDERVLEVSKAGEGNMNCTLRAITTRQRLIVKQARPWVEKYDQIAAPWDRSLVEAAFYRVVGSCAAAASEMPRLLDADAEARVLVLEDLGGQGDFTTIYAGARLTADDCARLAGYLQHLQSCRVASGDRALLANREMRMLNHEHIFRFPLREANGLALDAITPGLQARADALKKDRRYVDRVLALGERYLADGDDLVHGDYFPGSWLRTPGGIAVIDPEFCFLGAREFDVGVMLAHLRLAAQPAMLSEQLVGIFAEECDALLIRQFAGAEIMRRLIGVAQLPLSVSIGQKCALLEESRVLVMSA